MSAPGVQYKERDLSGSAPSNDGVAVGVVIASPRGKVGKPMLIGDKTALLKRLTMNNAVEIGYDNAFWSALEVLKSTGNLFVSRAVSATAKLSGADVTGSNFVPLATGVASADDVTLVSQSIVILAADQGAWGDKLKVAIFGYKDDEVATVATSVLTVAQKWGKGFPVRVYSDTLPAVLNTASTYFVIPTETGKIQLAATQEDALNTTPKSIDLGSFSGELRLSPAVRYAPLPGTFCLRVFLGTSQKYTDYVVSKSTKARDGNNRNLFIEDVLRDTDLIQAKNNPLVTTDPEDQVVPVALGGGSDGTAVTDGDAIRALELFSNTFLYKTDVIMDGGRTSRQYHAAMTDLCTRVGSFAVLAAPVHLQLMSNPAQEIVAYRKYELNLDTEFGALYAPNVACYDEFNDRDMWVSPDGSVARAIVDTALNYEIWYPVAGNKRGRINTTQVMVDFTETEEGLLYDAGINPIRFEPGKGIRIWGQKNLLAHASMKDRIHVRLMLNYLRPVMTDLMEDFLHDFSDEDAWTIATSRVDAKMQQIHARKGVQKWMTICNETNNTAADLDEHIMRVDLLVCPKGSTEWIPFTVGVVNNSVSMELAAQAL